MYGQGALLVARTLLTDYVSRLEGKCGRWILQQDWAQLGRVMGLFCAAAVPAALVNSGLKYMQKRIKLAFMRRLTLRLHELYCDHRAYYAASTLGGRERGPRGRAGRPTLGGALPAAQPTWLTCPARARKHHRSPPATLTRTARAPPAPPGRPDQR